MSLYANKLYTWVGTPSLSRFGSELYSGFVFDYKRWYSAFSAVVTPLRTKRVSIPHWLPNKISVLRLSPTNKKFSFGVSYNLCCSLRSSKQPISGLPIIFGDFSTPDAVAINFTKEPPDGLSLSFPSFLSMFVPISSALF